MKANNYRKRRLFLIANKVVSVITLIFFSAGNVFALPAGQQVVNGQASFLTQGNNLTITNSPNSIINWQGFSINNNEAVRFIQQNGASAVLNRVLGQDPSLILGLLQSNGRVFLINPNGMLFGQGAKIDVNGLFASTLNIGNQDFLAGKYNFTAGNVAGSIRNQGTITTPAGGKVYLIAPDIENSGIINSPQGNVLLAAGHSVQLVDSLDPDIAVVVSAPADKAVNLGQIVAQSGKVGIYGGLIAQNGTVSADSAVIGENGRIFFKASKDVTLASGSTTSASGTSGGQIHIQSETGTTLVSGTVTAAGSDGKGGDIRILGKQVGLIDNAGVDASGKSGGGTVLIGGDYQGKNAAVQNAEATYVGPDTTIKADATNTGDGGKVIVWSDQATQVYGKISARGGAFSGDGGFIETSGKYLDVARAADASAPNGKAGTWLLDPHNVTIQSATGLMNYPPFTPYSDDSTISNTVINTALDLGTSVTINTGTLPSPYGGSQAGDITVSAPITKSAGTDTTLTLTAHNNININEPITSTSGALNLTLNHGGAGSATLANSLSLADGNVDVGKYIPSDVGGVTSGAGTLNVTGGTTSLTGTLAATNLSISGGTLNLNGADTSITTFDLAGGALGGSAALTVAGAFNVTRASTLTGSGLLTTQGTSSVNMDATNGLLSLNKSWTNTGTLTVGGDDYISFNTGTLTNDPAGTLNLSSSYATPLRHYSGTNTVNNAGILNQTLTGTHGVDVTFNNNTAGRVYVLDGTLQLTANGTDTGAYDIAAGKTLNFANGTRNIETGAAFTGTGTLLLSGGTTNLNSDLTITAPTVELAGATFSGTGNPTIAGPFNITGGSTLAGTGTLKTSGNTSVSMPATANGLLSLNKSWTNTGILTVGGDDYISFNTGTLTNDTAGTINLSSSYATPLHHYTGTNTINNAGILNQTLTGAHGVDVTFNNTGTVNVDAGTLQLTANGTDTGSYVIDPGTTLSFASGTRNIETGTAFTGAGTFLLSGGTTNMNATALTISTPTVELAGGTLAGSGALTVSGPFNITGGSTLAGTGTLKTSGTSSVSMAATTGSVSLNKNWTNTGTLTVGGDDYISFSGGTLTNQPDGTGYPGTLNLSSSYATPLHHYTGTNTINNAGILNQTLTGAHGVDVTFNNTGTVNVDAGTLQLTANGTDTGSYVIDPGKTLNFANGTRNIESGAAFTGAGTFLLSGGTTNMNATALTISTPTVELAGGTLAGSGALTVSGPFNVTGGSTLAGAGTLKTSGTSSVSMAATTGSVSLNKSWTNTGTLTVGGDDYISFSGGTLTNQPDGTGYPGTLNLSSSYATPLHHYTGTNTINNAGILNQTLTGAHGVDVTFNNTGTVNVDAGTLQLTANGTDTGSYVIDPGTTLNFASGTRNIETGTAFTGTGTFLLSGGTTNMNATALTISTPTVELAGGTLAGSGALTVSGPFNITGGSTLAGTGTLKTSGTSSVSMAATTGSVSLNKNWTNTGTLTVGGDDYISFSGGTLTNQPDGTGYPGTLNLSSSYATPLHHYTGTNTINNAGILNQTLTGTHGVDVTFNNTGTVNVDAGTLQLTANGTDTGSYVIDPGTTLNFANGTRNIATGAAFTGTGTLLLSGGTTNLNSDLTITAPTVELAGATLSGTGNPTIAGPFNITGGSTLAGTGTLKTSGNTSVSMAATTGSVSLNKNWTNTGTLTVGGDDYISFSGGTLTNQPDGTGYPGTLNLSSSYATPLHHYTGTNTINNAGILNQTLTGAHGVDVTFNNTGTVNVDAGTLQLTANGTDTGSYVIDPGTTLSFASGTRNIETGTAFTGAGTFLLSGGTTNMNATALTISTPTVELAGGTLAGSGALTVSGPFNITGGSTLAGTGTLKTSGTSSVSMAATTGSVSLNKNWTNTGTLTVGGDDYISFSGGTLTNQPDGTGYPGTLNLSSSYATPLHHYTGTNTINNAGILNQTLTGAHGVDVTFNNTGTVNVDAGTLQLTANGTDTGSYVIDPGKTLNFANGTRNIETGTAFTGAGTLLLSGGTTNLNSDLTITAPTVELAGATLSGTGNPTIAGPFNITGGSTLAGTGTLKTSGNTSVSMAATTGSVSLNKNWTNTGTLTVGGDDLISFSGGTLTNDPAGTLNLSSSYATPLHHYTGTNTINNAGILNQTLTGTHGVDVTFNNTGTVNVDAGTLQLTANGTDTGSYVIDPGTTLNFANGTRNIATGAAFTGTGTLLLSGGTTNLNSDLTITAPTVELAGATLSGTGNPTIAGPFNITGGSTLAGTGTLKTSGTSSVSMAATTGSVSLNKNWTNTGALTVGGDDLISFSGGTLTNDTAGTLNLSSSYATPLHHYTGTNTINNAGILNQTLTGTHGVDVTFNNTGTVNVQSGGMDVAGSFSTSGTIEVPSGTTFNKTGGFTNTGTIGGTGTINVGAGNTLTNNGTLRPGLASGTTTGTLSITGNYTQGATGQLNIELGGTGTGLYDKLATTGNVTIGGTLNATLLGGYTPASGDYMPFLTMSGTASGTFATTSLPGGFTASYNMATGEASRLFYSAAAGKTFTNAVGGLTWETAGNWSGGVLPAATDDTFINNTAGYAVTHGIGNDTVGSLTITANNSLNISGGSLTVNGTTTLGGLLTTSGTGVASLSGALNGGSAGQTGQANISGGTLNVNATGLNTIYAMNLSAGTLAGNGTLTLTGAGSNWSGGKLSGTGTLEIGTTGTLNALTGGAAGKEVNSGYTLSNKGLMSWSAGDINVNNNGAIVNQAGATLDVTASANVALTYGGAGAQLTNYGTIRKSGSAATATIGIPLNSSGGTFDAQAGTLLFNATPVFAANGATGTTFSGAGVNQISNGATINDGFSSTNLDLTAGTLTGVSTLNSGTMTWSGGSLSGSGKSLTVAGGGTLNLAGALNLSSNFNLNNAGTLNMLSGSLNINNAGVLTNQAGGVFNIGGGRSIAYGGAGATLNNAGTLNSQTGVNTVDVSFGNTGTVAVANGATLKLSRGGSGTGAFTAGTGSTLEFGGGTYALGNGANFSGTGVALVSTGVLNTDATATATAQNLALSGGSVGGAGTLKVNGTMDWTGGSLSGGAGTGTLEIGTTGTLNALTGGASGKEVNSGYTLSNKGLMSWSAGDINVNNNGAIVNQAGATLDVTASANVALTYGGAGAQLTNYGTIRKSGSAATATIGIPLSSSGGTFDAQAGTLLFNATPVFAANGATGTTFSGAGVNQISNGATINDGFSSTNLDLTAGTLTGVSTLNSGTMTWSGGSLSGSGKSLTVAGGGTLNLAGALNLSSNFNLNNAGTLNMLSGSLNINNAGVLTNQAGGVFNIGGGRSIAYGGAGATLNNAGTLNSQTGINTIDVSFGNTGTVAVANGATLKLSRGGSGTGAFTAGTGSTLEFGGGTYALGNGANFSGTGVALVSTGVLNTDATATATAQNLALSGGSVGGAGTLKVNGTMDWTGGSLSGGAGTGTLEIGTTGTLNALTGGASGKEVNSGYTLSNKGLMSWSAGDINVNNNGAIVNQAGATLDVTASANVALTYGGAGAQLTNYGTIRKSGSAATATIGIPLNSSGGTFDAQAGTLLFNATPVFAANGATGTTFSGAGVNQISNGATINDGFSSTNLDLTAGTLTGVSTLNSGTMTWSGGSLSGSGKSLTVAGGGTLNLAGALNLSSNFNLNNAGTLNMLSGSLNINNAGVLTNQAGGVFNIGGGRSIAYGGAGATLNNAGTLNSQTGVNTVDVSFGNTGIVNVQSDTLKLNSLAANTNSGTIDVTGGTLSTNGNPLVNASIGTIRGSGTINLGSATLTNNGSVNPGAAGGATTGTLSLTGNYTQAATGQLNIELRGAGAGQYDELAVTGNVALGGTLSAAILGSYTPANRDSKAVITMGGTASGNFATTSLPTGYSAVYNPGPGKALSLLYSTTAAKIFTNASTAHDLTWENPANWSDGGLPGSTDEALLSLGYAVKHGTGNDTVGSLSINADNSLNISGGSLTVNNATNLGGTLTVSDTGSATLLGSLNGGTTGLLNVSSGSLALNGIASVASMNLSGSGTLQGNGSLTVTTNFNQTGGTVGTGFQNLSLNKIGDLTVGSLAAANSLILRSTGGNVALNGTLTTTAGDITVAAANNFVNNFGSTVFNPGGSGRWLVYSSNPASDTRGGLSYNFKQYNAVYGSTAVQGSGNGFLYSVAPVLTPQLIGTVQKTYDGNNTATLAASNYSVSGMIDGDTVILNNPGSGTYDNKNAGSGKAVTVTGVSVNNVTDGTATVYGYTLATNTASGNIGTITPRSLTVTATGVNKVYDGLTGATVTLADNRIAEDLLSTGYTGAAYPDKNVGTGKTVNVNGINLTGTDAGNYTANTTAATTADITPRSLTVTATGVNKVYDGLTGATVTLADNRIAEDLLSTGYTGAAYPDKNVGTGKTVNVNGINLTGTDAGNYTANTTAATTADITPRSLTVTATGVNKVYDGLTGATVTLADNRIAEDLLSTGYTGAAYPDKNVGTGKTVNVNGINLTGTDAGNYTANTTAATTADITPRSLTVTATGVNKVYDGLTGATVTLADNRIAEDLLSTGYTGAAYPDKNVGTGKTVNVNGINLTGTDAGNYTANTTAATTADITPRSLTVTATGVNKVYDGLTGATVTLADNRIAEDLLSTGYTGAAYPDKNVGTGKTVNVNGINLTGTDAGNYTANTTAATTADITPRSLTVTATGVNKVYDGLTGATVTLADNRIAEDLLSTGYTGAAYPDKNVGTGKTVNVNGINLTGTDAGNYTANTTAATTADITPRSLTVTATGVNKVYDGLTGATVTLADNRIAEDLLSTGYTGAAYPDKNVGTGKTVNVNGINLTGTDAGNYTANTTAATTADITPRSLTVTATGVNKVYDGLTGATVTLADNRIAEDLLSTGYTNAAYPDKNVGTGKTVNVNGINLTGIDAGNYTANTTAATTADITPRSLTVTATGVNKVYDGLTGATVTLADNRIAEDLLSTGYTGAAYPDKNVGTGKTVNVNGINLTGTDAGNYTPNTTATTTADITVRPLTVTAATNTKGYDGNTSATATPSITSGSLASSDTAKLSEGYDSKIAGTGKTLKPAAVISDGNGGNNYLVTYVNNTTGVIEPGQIISGILDVAAGGKTIYFAVNGALLPDQAATDVSGNYSLMLPLNSIPNNSALLAYVANDTSLKSASVYLSTGGDIANLSLSANTVTAGGGGTMSNSTFGIAKGSLSSGDIPYSLSGANLSLSPNFNFKTASGTAYSINGNITTTNGAHIYNGSLTILGNAMIGTGTGNISFGGPVTGTGNLTLNSQGTVTQTAPISISGLELTGTGGTYNLTDTGNAVITLAGNTGTVNFTNSSGIDIGTVNTAGLATSGNLTLISGGAITQSVPLQVAGVATFGAGTANDITLMNAGNNFSSVGITSGKDVSLKNVGPLALNASTVSNSLSATAGGDITLQGLVSAGTGLVTLNSGGAIINGMGGATSIAAGALVAEAVNGIGSGDPLMTAVNELTALNATANNIEIDNTGVLTVSDLSNLGTGNVILQNIGAITTNTSLVTASGGDVSITAHSPLTIGTGGVSASGNISLVASPSDGADNLTINGNIASANGSIILKAGSSIVFSPGSDLSAPKGTITMSDVHGTSDTSTSTEATGNTNATNTTVAALKTTEGTIIAKVETTSDSDKKEDEKRKKKEEGGEQKTDDKKTGTSTKNYCN